MFLYVLRIVGAMSLVFVLALIVTSKLWYNRTISRSASSRFFWETFCPALTAGLVLCVVPAILGSSDNDEFIFTDFSKFLAYAGFCTLLITGGVIVYWKHRAKEEAKAKNEEKNKDDARAYFALAINYLTEGDIDSALRAYQNVEERDEVLASELYNQIFSGEANQQN